MKTSENPPKGGLRTPRQARGQATLDALISAGRQLIEEKSFEELTVAEVAEAAGYSVGSFYLRFEDKVALLQALIAEVLAEKNALEQPFVPGIDDERALEAVVHELVDRYRRRRGLLRASIRMSMTNPSIWEPLKQHGKERADLLVSYFKGRVDERRIRFALQVLYGTLNHTTLLSPGPLLLDDAEFEAELLRTFKLVLLGAGPQPAPARRVSRRT